jgi:hypothetical protein
MSILLRGRPRPLARLTILTCTIVVGLAACGSTSPTPPIASPTDLPSVAPSPTPTSSPTPVPTPRPTPRFTNEPDPQLLALIPDTVAGSTVVKPAVSAFGVTPGDIGEVYGDVGLRFESLQLAYVAPRKLSLYAMRMREPLVGTADLEPYLAAAGEYVGIAGLHRDPWELKTVAGHIVWARPEDNATAAGTMVYTWAVDEYVFLMIGTDDALNTAMLTALPGEAAPTPSPRPSATPRPSPSASGSPAAS